MTPALPMHLVDLLTVGDGVHTFADTSGIRQYLVIDCSFNLIPDSIPVLMEAFFKTLLQVFT